MEEEEEGERLLRSGRQGGKLREEAGFNQTLSRSVYSEWASPPGCSFTERMHAAGGLIAVHAGRGPDHSRDKSALQHYNVNSGK